MREYQNKFESLSTKVTEVSKNTLKEMFISGLKLEIQKLVIQAIPATLGEAMVLANLHENDELGVDIPQYSTTITPSSSGGQKSSNQYIPPHNRITEGANNSWHNKSFQPKVRVGMTEAEKEVKWSKQECFNCEEKWVKGLVCKGKLFLLSIDGNSFNEVNDSNGEEVYQDAQQARDDA